MVEENKLIQEVVKALLQNMPFHYFIEEEDGRKLVKLTDRHGKSYILYFVYDENTETYLLDEVREV